ncbi:MAG: N-succinylarginine dihydrolase [Proteobacteria bacterium]|nr:N-succinylarginine dihydrolase [Pseudomonadota bacterium]
MNAPALEANADGLVGPTHSFAGLAPGNLASEANRGRASNPRAALFEGLAKMARLAELGLPQFVLPPHERPAVWALRRIGFEGDEAQVLERAWREAPALAAAASSASSMWAANAATVTPSADSGDGRVHLTPANLLSHPHRALEAGQTTRSLQVLFPDRERFVVHDALPAQPHFADEGAANHVRLSADQGEPGVELLVWGREAYQPWTGRFPARQTREAAEAVARRHGSRRPVFAQQGRRAIEGGAFHNDVVSVGTRTCLFHHESAFEDTARVYDDIRRAADGLFEPVFLEVTEEELPLTDVISSYLFNSMLVQPPGEDRLVLVAPAETCEQLGPCRLAKALPGRNGPIGRVEFIDVRQSMSNGGGPACLRLRVVLTQAELDAANSGQRFTAALHAALRDWGERRYREVLTPDDLRDPQLLEESRTALDELTGMLGLGSDFYPFQRA